MQDELRIEIKNLLEKGVTPKIAIVTIGPEKAWQIYVGRKIKFADENNIEKVLVSLANPTEEVLIGEIQQLNENPSIHGIIVQRPLPKEFDNNRIINAVKREKDIDGFRADSPFEVPVWMAILRVLEEIQELEAEGGHWLEQGFSIEVFLDGQNIVVIGKGESGGKHIIEGFTKLGMNPIVIDSATKAPEKILSQADIIVSAVGKKVINPENLKNGVVLIGVGINRGEDEKLHGDYEVEEIKDIASYYTPTPEGIGPLNLTYLFKNLLEASSRNNTTEQHEQE